MTAIGKKSLELFRAGCDTYEISQRLSMPQNVICDAIELAREEEKQQKEETTKCQQPQEQLESS